MVANQNIAKGTVLLEEDALVVVDTRIIHANWNTGQNAANFYVNERANTTNRIQASFGSNRWRNNRGTYRNLFIDNPPPGAPQRLLDVMVAERNAFSFENPAENNNEWLVVYNELSRVNHSCVPNARISDVWTGSHPNPNPDHLGRMKLIATQDIAANDEIMIEYVTGPAFWLQPRATRRPHLLTHWNFHCLCDACHQQAFQLPEATWIYTNALSGEIYRPHPPAGQTDVLAKRIELYISILNFHGFGDGRLSRA